MTWLDKLSLTLFNECGILYFKMRKQDFVWRVFQEMLVGINYARHTKTKGDTQ